MMLLHISSRIRIVFILFVVGMLVWSCSENEETTPAGPENGTDLTADCIGCHSNEDLLKATAVPDENPPGDPSGEG